MYKIRQFTFTLIFALALCAASAAVAAAPVYAADFGFNVWALAKASPENISKILNDLSSNCQTTIVRLWGFQQTQGIDGLNNLQKVLDNAPATVKFIVALEDFPSGPPAGNPGAWFGGGYQASYRPYVQQIVSKYKGNSKIFMWELMNEPHCTGDTSCSAKLVSWARDISDLIASIDPGKLISPGMIGDNIQDQAYDQVTALPNITANSCHLYNTNGPNTDCTTLRGIVGGKYFYIGEAGYVTGCLNNCSYEQLQPRAQWLSEKSSAFSANAFLVWQYSDMSDAEMGADDFSVFSTEDPICTGDFGAMTSRPSRLEPLIGRDPYDRLKVREDAAAQAQLAQKVSRYDIVPYCPAMGVNQPDVNPTAMSLTQYKYCTKDESRFAVEGRGFISCPDYSPNRPYPGDTCLNYTDIKTTNVTTFSQPVFETGGKVTYDLCRKEKSSIPGVPASFPCLPQKYTVLVPQKKQVTYDKAFVEYLGTNDEYTSNPNAIMSLKNNIARTSQYLTDYLGGFAHAPGVRDRSRAMAEFLRAIYDLKLVVDNSLATQAQKDAAYQKFQETIAKIENLKEILQLTSGVMAKLSPQKWAEVQFDSNKVLLGRWLASNLPSTNGEKPKDKVEKTPIGDYVVAWTCPETVNEEEFGDSLDRTQATIKTKGKTKDCKNPHPIRISEFICGNANAWADAKATFGLLADEICRGKKTGSSEGEAQIVYWPNFMPLTTREDTPVRVQISCESSKDEKGGPPPYPRADKILTEKELREFMASKNTPDADTYYIDNPHKTPGNPYLVISRKFIYVGHLAEARELSYYTGNMLLPKAMQDTVLKNPKMDELDPAIAAGDVKTAVAKTGDLIAEDAKLRYFKDSDKINVVTAIKQDHGTPPTWGGSGDPPYATVDLKNTCTIQVEMPYIAEVAARTIGKDAGFMRLFLPQTVGDDLSKNVRSQENKGAGVALSSYASEHDFIKFVDESGGEIWPAAGEPGVDRADGRIYIPWVKEMQAFQKVAIGQGLNPYLAQSQVESALNPQPGSSREMPGSDTSTPAYQQCMTSGIDFKNTSIRPNSDAFDRMSARYSGSWLGTQGRKMWDELISIAANGGFNPVLALAYWGEETHFTNPSDNGNPKKALGCGAFSDGTTCIKNYPAEPERELRDEFQCIVAKNTSGSCNVAAACTNQADTLGFIGCYQYGAGNAPGDTHLTNLIKFYYDLLGQSAPDCSQFK